MALKELLEKLSSDLEIPMPKLNEQKIYPMAIGKEITVSFRDLAPGCSFFAPITDCPQTKREELFIYLMKANFLGQGTGGARIGLDQDEKVLTLVLGFPYEINYQLFKESVEDFVNYVIYWRDEVAKMKQEQ